MKPSKNRIPPKGEYAEQAVQTLAFSTFLTDWCYTNPKTLDGKEICDLLVLFDDICIIWQIKDVRLNESEEFKNSDYEKNLRQLLGARRRLFHQGTPVELFNPRRGIEYFDSSRYKFVHLISAFYCETPCIANFAEIYDGQVVHNFTKEFTDIVLNELDTIKDFLQYLIKKEELVNSDKHFLLLGGEKDLLAYYLLNNRTFANFNEATSIVLDEGSWEHAINEPRFKAKKEEDKISYYWDSIIERAHQCKGEYEKVARELARTSRFQRRYLSKAFYDAHVIAERQATHWSSRSLSADDRAYCSFRRTLSIDGLTYCFLFQDEASPRSERANHLKAYCFVARGICKTQKVLGIATESQIHRICSYDFCLLDFPEWSDTQQIEMETIQREIGINPR